MTLRPVVPRCLLVGLAALVLAGAASAHDYWIQPRSFEPRLDTILAVELRVGDHGQGEPVARNAEHLVRFVALGQAGSRDVVGRDGRTPAGYLRLDAPGPHLLVYESRRRAVELDGPAFDAYLREKGLDDVLARRRELGANGSVRELYSRCAKALVTVTGEAREPRAFDRVTGLALELVPLRDPRVGESAEDGTTHAFRVLLDGRPLAKARIAAVSLEGVPGAAPLHSHEHGEPHHHHATGERPHVGRTDDQGVARLELSAPGRWLVTTTHMREARPEEDADWVSVWSSLTFELRARPRSGDRP